MAAGCQTVDRQSIVHGLSLEYCKAPYLGAFGFRNPYTDVGLQPHLAGVSKPILFSLTESASSPCLAISAIMTLTFFSCFVFHGDRQDERHRSYDLARKGLRSISVHKAITLGHIVPVDL